uniref:Uncharacterized protein n=1 Tax=Strongyloides stercoralis TaxID=6248 RepID=A0AAF5HZC5_STRER
YSFNALQHFSFKIPSCDHYLLTNSYQCYNPFFKRIIIYIKKYKCQRKTNNCSIHYFINKSSKKIIEVYVNQCDFNSNTNLMITNIICYCTLLKALTLITIYDLFNNYYKLLIISVYKPIKNLIGMNMNLDILLYLIYDQFTVHQILENYYPKIFLIIGTAVNPYNVKKEFISSKKNI